MLPVTVRSQADRVTAVHRRLDTEFAGNSNGGYSFY